ncbi:tail fiber domain-containing protein [Phaeobacter sp. HF9A]|uniref:tail fiber domain-containing protein n=1 Tax=Phaeobacter sp. HF9A TaxID=2721561 RepID=UPI00142FDC11|nr:tail fiber domain-containing protein [Phaeobacter sp. HF9A]NIZ15176.1 tail fiber domain-containing protein [Phaeobacter sp. HF9A]
MSIPSFSAFPEIPQRSTPEADFDAKMYALFQHFATTHRQELLAFIQFLENNVTAIEGAINGVTIGLTHPAAAKFTSLAADNISGAAVQASPDDTTAGRLMKVGAFGLGGNAQTPPNNDLDQIGAAGGLYYGDGAQANTPPQFGNSLVLHMPRNAEIWTQIAVNRGAGDNRIVTRRKTGAGAAPTPWSELVVLDESGRTAQNVEIRNSGPFLAITDADTGVKHTLSGNSTAGHLYIKTDPAENMPNSALLIETQGVRQMAIAKDEIDINVPIGTYLGIGATAQSPATALHIKGTGVTDSKMTVERSGVTGAVGVVSQDLLLNGTGSTGTNGGINFYTGGGSNMRLAPDGTLRPANDGTQNLGNASYRWDVVYASTGTINTSDARSKIDIQDLDAAEHRVAVAAKSLLKKYRIRDAVAEKGDAARWHFGVIAQELAAVFEDEGLDPWRYGVLCWDEWWSAEFEIPAETAPIMREVVERVVHTYPVLNDVGEPTGETREKVEEVRKKVDTGEVKIIEPARTELRKYDREEDAPEGAEYHNRQGVRYDELFAFILAAL